MIRRFPIILFVIALGAGAGYMAASGGCGHQGQEEGSGQVKIARPTRNGNGVTLRDETVSAPKGQDPVETALSALLASGESGEPAALPKGTRLLSVKVDGGVATIDFSEEFNSLRDAGNTRESLAQNALRKTLAQFPKVDKMLVRVNGKPFESDHTDWTEPIPVRDTKTAGNNP